jgi:SAM-dependent methyltransferase
MGMDLVNHLFRIKRTKRIEQREFNKRILSYLFQTYASGKGVEIGPGNSPITPPERTIYLDKFHYDLPKEYDFRIIEDASKLALPDQSQDFLISSHCLEHCPDTLRTLLEWRRVLAVGGHIILRLPHGKRTFDRGRPLHGFNHHLADYLHGVNESDSEHFEEFAQYSIPQYEHLWISDPDSRKPDGSWDFSWIKNHGHLHWHVWTAPQMVEILTELGFEIVFAMDDPPDDPSSFWVVGRRVGIKQDCLIEQLCKQ